MEFLPGRHCGHLDACQTNYIVAVRCNVYKETLFPSVKHISRMLYNGGSLEPQPSFFFFFSKPCVAVSCNTGPASHTRSFHAIFLISISHSNQQICNYFEATIKSPFIEMKVVRLLVLYTRRLYPREIFLVLISVRG